MPDAGLVDLAAPHDLLGARRRLEERTVQRHQAGREQSRFPADQHEGTTRSDNRGPIVAAEIGDRLEVGGEPAHQPHGLHVAPAFPLQPTRRTHFGEVAVDVKLQKITRIVTGPPGRCPNCPPKTQSNQVQPIGKSIDHPQRSIRRNLILNTIRKQ